MRIRVQVRRTYVGDERYAEAPMLSLCMKVRKGSGPPVQIIAFTKTQKANVALKDVVKDCQYFFGAVLPSVLVLRKAQS